MTRHDSHLKTVAYHNHSHFVHAELLFQILRMACISESLSDHSPLVDRGSDQNIDISFLDILHSPLKRGHSSLCRFRGRLTRLDEHIFRKTVDYIHSLLMHILRGADHIGIDLVYIMNLFLVETEYL